MFALIMALVGGLVGGGLLLIVRGAVGPVATVADFVAELHRPRPTDYALAQPKWTDKMLAATAGRSAERNRQDLDICERSTSKFAQDRLTWAALMSAPGLFALAAVPLGVTLPLPPAIFVIAIIAGAVGGWLYAIADLKTDALKNRRDFRHALSAYLELVTILMAGGAGVQSAMYDAAAIGRGTSFRHMKSALSQAQARRETPWMTLGALGARLGVVELVELEASMTLAGGGARVRDSLRAKAEAMRDRDRAEQESEAERKSESMVLPVAMMFAGFLLLIGYPALSGLSGP